MRARLPVAIALAGVILLIVVLWWNQRQAVAAVPASDREVRAARAATKELDPPTIPPADTSPATPATLAGAAQVSLPDEVAAAVKRVERAFRAAERANTTVLDWRLNAEQMTAVTEVKALTEEQIAQIEIAVAEEFAGFSADSPEHLLLDSELEKLSRRYSDTNRVVVGSHSYDPDKKSYMEISGSGSTTVTFDEKDNARIRTVGASRQRLSWGPEDDRYEYVFEVVAEAARQKKVQDAYEQE